MVKIHDLDKNAEGAPRFVVCKSDYDELVKISHFYRNEYERTNIEAIRLTTKVGLLEEELRMAREINRSPPEKHAESQANRGTEHG